MFNLMAKALKKNLISVLIHHFFSFFVLFFSNLTKTQTKFICSVSYTTKFEQELRFILSKNYITTNYYLKTTLKEKKKTGKVIIWISFTLIMTEEVLLSTLNSYLNFIFHALQLNDLSSSVLIGYNFSAATAI